jgi:hypothetical protein
MRRTRAPHSIVYSRNSLASSKIKKKAPAAKASAMPRQAAIPCLVLVALALLVIGLILFFSLRSAS